MTAQPSRDIMRHGLAILALLAAAALALPGPAVATTGEVVCRPDRVTVRGGSLLITCEQSDSRYAISVRDPSARLVMRAVTLARLWSTKGQFLRIEGHIWTDVPMPSVFKLTMGGSIAKYNPGIYEVLLQWDTNRVGTDINGHSSAPPGCGTGCYPIVTALARNRGPLDAAGTRSLEVPPASPQPPAVPPTPNDAPPTVSARGQVPTAGTLGNRIDDARMGLATLGSTLPDQGRLMHRLTVASDSARRAETLAQGGDAPGAGRQLRRTVRVLRAVAHQLRTRRHRTRAPEVVRELIDEGLLESIARDAQTLAH